METYFAVMIFILGAIIGSFLNVVLYRWHTGKSLNGHSHCLSCGTGLRWYELFPVCSYLCLRGRCRSCLSWIPARYFWVELVTGILFLAAWCAIDDLVWLLFTVFLIPFLMLISVYDLRHTIIPDEFTAGVLGVTLLLLGYQSYVAQDWYVWIVPVLSGLGAAGFFGSLWLVSAGRWIGFGDVKLAFPLGMIVSFPGVFSMIVLAFWVGAGMSIALMAGVWLYQRYYRRVTSSAHALTMKSEVPFAPFLIIGFLLVYLLKADVLDLFFYAFF